MGMWEAMMARVQAAARPERARVRIGNRDFNLLVARTPAEWRTGLVGYEQNRVDGMVFVSDEDTQRGFHTATLAGPILLAYFDANGEFVAADRLTERHPVSRPARPYRYAIELIGSSAETFGALALLPDLQAGIRKAPWFHR